MMPLEQHLCSFINSQADADLNLSRADVEKQRMNSNIKRQQMDDSKNEYANQLQKTNDLQRQFYGDLMPGVFQSLQVRLLSDNSMHWN